MSTTSSPSGKFRASNPGNVQEIEVDLNDMRKYPSVQEYYMASSKTDDVPITYQNGLSNYSSLVLGDDRIMLKESLMTFDFKPKFAMELSDEQLRLRARPANVRRREYIDAVRAIGWKEVDRMERIVRDKLKQRSFATSSPFQVRKSFKFFDTEKKGTLDAIGLTRALVFLGFEFSPKQITALFARYDVQLIGTIDYMKFYKTCMDKNDDAPPIIPDTSHLGEEFENSYVSRPNTSISENSVQTVESTGYTDDELRTLQKAEVQRIFSMLDKIGGGSIAAEDFELLLLALNIQLTPGELYTLTGQLCTNDRIDFEDFFAWWHSSSSRK